MFGVMKSGRRSKKGQRRACCGCESCHCACHDSSLTPDEQEQRINERKQLLAKSNREVTVFFAGIILMLICLPFLAAKCESILDGGDAPRFMKVDGKPCRLVNVKVGTYISHGMTHNRYEVQATCQSPE